MPFKYIYQVFIFHFLASRCGSHWEGTASQSYMNKLMLKMLYYSTTGMTNDFIVTTTTEDALYWPIK